MLWQIDGASEETGEEVSLTLEAPSRQAAEAEARRRGVMIAAVVLRERSMPEELAAAQQARSLIGYQTPPGVPAPKYWGLRIAAGVLAVVAVLYYIAGAFLIAAPLIQIVSAAPQYRGIESLIFSSVGGGMLLVAAGGLLHGVSAGCMALRDIAINSFTRR